MQFQSAGRVRTVPFELNVADAVRKPAYAIPADAIRIDIKSGGFEPARIEIPAGKPVKLAFVRSGDPNCGSKVVFADLGITRDVPMRGIAIMEIPAQAAGEIRFACGMGMYRGRLIMLSR
jgi:plastocyanin domain-containing protein